MNDSEVCPEGWGRGGVHATRGVVVVGAGAEVAGTEPAGEVVTVVVAGRTVGCDDELLQAVETNATVERQGEGEQSAVGLHDRLILGHARAAGACAGIETTKRVPPPGRASARAVPPIAAASSRTIARPSPVPTARPDVSLTV